ncbi:glycosyltransferase [Candidatus Saccharibacteria bacterium]|nr:glycosyltransferase [Candidatus Saccharibacteria bacterium]
MIKRMITLVFIELYVVAFSALVFVLVKLRKARRTFLFTRPPRITSSDQLPSVSVCIPARNETHAMSECLESVLASDYPKLEAIVLDDHSSDNTSHIIRAFAHAGVRFVEGDELPDDWLGKNFSLQTLANEASGKIILFMDVDTRLERESIRLMVEDMLFENRKMLAVIPQRNDTYRASSWLSTLRYFWELVLNSRTIPGVSSAAWMIDRHVLIDELGGFGEWRDEVQPESHIAAELTKTDEYQLVVSTPALGVNFEKKWASQIETSRRLLLPRFGNSVTSVLLGASLSCTVIMTQIVIIVAILERSWIMLGVEALLGGMAVIVFAQYYRMTLRSRWPLALFLSPYIVWQELYLLLSSVVGYKRGTITWKGRVVKRPTRKRTLL